MKNQFPIFVATLLAFSSAFCFMSCDKDDDTTTQAEKSRDVMFQVVHLQSLLDGNYDGVYPISSLKKYGDFGLGTFDKINGEMIVLDGIVYQALGDGSVITADDNELIPFANISYFDNDEEIVLEKEMNEKEVETFLNEKLAHKNFQNKMCLVRIEGSFSNMLVRSELQQTEKPYKPLADVLATDERQFTYENISGLLIAMYFPETMEKLNATGWHFHFISNDKSKGGHVLSFSMQQSAKCILDYTNEFQMILP